MLYRSLKWTHTPLGSNQMDLVLPYKVVNILMDGAYGRTMASSDIKLIIITIPSNIQKTLEEDVLATTRRLDY